MREEKRLKRHDDTVRIALDPRKAELQKDLVSVEIQMPNSP